VAHFLNCGILDGKLALRARPSHMPCGGVCHGIGRRTVNSLHSGDAVGRRDRHETARSQLGLVGLIAGGILLSPIFGFLMALVVDILIGLLNDGGMPALLTFVVASVIGGFLFRAMLPRPWASASVGA